MKRIQGRMVGLLVAALLPGMAWAQWSHTGNFNVNGYIGAGTANPARGIHLQGDNAIFRMDRDRDSTSFMMVRTALNDFNTIQKAFLFSVNSSGVNDGQFAISDKGAAVSGPGGTRRFTIANNGRVGIGRMSTPEAGLHVRNPAAGLAFRVDDLNGVSRLSVDTAGNLHNLGDTVRIQPTMLTPAGYFLNRLTALFSYPGGSGPGTEAFLALNDRTAIISSKGQDGLLRIQDSDNNWTNYRFNNESVVMNHIGDITLLADKQSTGHELVLKTSGEQIQFVADYNNNVGQVATFTWFNNGHANSNRLMSLNWQGNLSIKGTLFQNTAFDIAEAYWKGDAEIEPGDVVCFDLEDPGMVRLARTAGDATVVGVVSTEPGIALGAGAFSPEQLAEVWGENVAAQFAKQRKAIEKELRAGDERIQARVAQFAKQKAALKKGGGGADAARLAAEQQREEEELAGMIEDAVVEIFCRNHFALVALAGRVPVKVDAAHGAIRPGNLLVASTTPGHAMRADNPAPGTVIGKAMESMDSGQGMIMMIVLNR